MTTNHRKNKAVEFHFVDMHDPNRYKKLKVAQACDFCRRRKSKCDIGIPNSGTCSNCQKHKKQCIFSSTLSNNKYSQKDSNQSQNQSQNSVFQCLSLLPTSIKCLAQQTPSVKGSSSLFSNLHNIIESLYLNFPLLYVHSAGYVGYQKIEYVSRVTVDLSLPVHSTLQIPYNSAPDLLSSEPSLELEYALFDIYFEKVHPFYPILHKKTVLGLLQKDRQLIPYGLRYAVMAIAYQTCPLTLVQLLSIDSRTSFANISYQKAKEYARHPSASLLTVIQTLLLLYHYEEMNRTALMSSSPSSVHYLESVEMLLNQIPDNLTSYTLELVHRAHWIFYINVSLSQYTNPFKEQLKDSAMLPSKLPCCFEDEMYDLDELNIIHYFTQLIQVAKLYFQVTYGITSGHIQTHSTYREIKDKHSHWLTSNPFPDANSSQLLTSRTSSKVFYHCASHLYILYDITYLISVLRDKDYSDTDKCVAAALRLEKLISTLGPEDTKKTVPFIQHQYSLSFALSLSVQICLLAFASHTASRTLPFPLGLLPQCLTTLNIYHSRVENRLLKEEILLLKYMLESNYVEEFICQSTFMLWSFKEEGSDVTHYPSQATNMYPLFYMNNNNASPATSTPFSPYRDTAHTTGTEFDLTDMSREEVSSANEQGPCCSDSEFPPRVMSMPLEDAKKNISHFFSSTNVTLYVDKNDNPITPTYPSSSDLMPDVYKTSYFYA
ncbi:hypothetical protein BDF14DRAFT_1879849 [Spinellus fusiger]|nr:hypothetical protein BDF14DRAFT_1879849 [Spinellus fusiger]